jgi:hypothetical protein
MFPHIIHTIETQYLCSLHRIEYGYTGVTDELDSAVATWLLHTLAASTRRTREICRCATQNDVPFAFFHIILSWTLVPQIFGARSYETAREEQ